MLDHVPKTVDADRLIEHQHAGDDHQVGRMVHPKPCAISAGKRQGCALHGSRDSPGNAHALDTRPAVTT
jgi:hypothetical protein